MCPHVCVCACARGRQRTRSGISFSACLPALLPLFLLPSLLPSHPSFCPLSFLSFPVFFWDGVLTEHLAYWFSWTSRPASPRILTASPAQHWDCSHTLELCVCFVLNKVLEIELSPYSYMASTLPTKPSHQPQVLVFKILDFRNPFTAQMLYSLSINVKI